MRATEFNSIKNVKVSELKINPNNPRIIKDEKFKQLVKSIQEFPEMLNIRPIVCDANGVILGGNMRFKACKEAGLKEVPVIYASDLTEAQKREFIIKDNVSGGEWDWEALHADFPEADEWGVDFKNILGKTFENKKENEPEFAYPITIISNEIQYAKWEELKKLHNEKDDTKLFFKLANI